MSSALSRENMEGFIDVRLRLFEFAASHSLRETLQKVLDEVGALVESPIGFLHFLSSDEKTISLQAWSTQTLKEFCKAEGKGLHYGIDQAGVWVDCIHQRRPVIHNDYLSLAHRKGLPPGHAPVVRELVVPVTRADRIVAILGIGNKPTDYTEKDVKIVAFLADVAWVIAGQKRAEEALHKEHEFTQNILNTAQVIILVLNPDGSIISINPFMEELSGYRLDEVQGKDWFATFLPETGRDDTRTLFMKAAVSGIRTRGHVNPIVLKNGTTRQIEWHDCPLMDKDGKVTGVLAVGQDVTERKAFEETLQKREAFLGALLDAIPIPVFYKDRAGRYLGFNKAFEAFFGNTREQLIGKSVFEINPPGLAQIYWAKDNELFESEEGVQQYEVKTAAAGGALHDVIVNKSVFKDEKEAVAGLIGALFDITDQKRAVQEREHLISDLQKALSQVKQLSGLLPICSYCKKIRNDEGYWEQIESYIHEHSQADFTHTICRECAKKYFPDLNLYK